MKNNSGFTLLELSIVMVVVGFMTVGALGISKGMMNSSRQNESKTKLQRVDEAIRSYIIRFGRLPCPTKINISVLNSEFGKEVCTPDEKGVRRLNTNTVLVGALPTKALNLENSYSYDGWGNKFVYAVVEQYTGSRDNLYNNKPKYNEKGENANLINGKFVYSITSNGRNRFFSYYYKGTKAQKEMESATEDIQNSFDKMKDNKIIDLSENEGFDDIVILKNRENLLQQINKFDQNCIIKISDILSEGNCNGFNFNQEEYNLKYREKIYSINGFTMKETITDSDGDEMEKISGIKRCIIECTDYGKAIAYSYDFNF